MVRRLRARLVHGRALLPHAHNPEPYRWRIARLRRRVDYWARRAARLQAQLQEVSDEYPESYVRVMRAAADVGLPTPNLPVSRRHAG